MSLSMLLFYLSKCIIVLSIIFTTGHYILLSFICLSKVCVTVIWIFSLFHFCSVFISVQFSPIQTGSVSTDNIFFPLSWSRCAVSQRFWSQGLFGCLQSLLWSSSFTSTDALIAIPSVCQHSLKTRTESTIT